MSSLLHLFGTKASKEVPFCRVQDAMAYFHPTLLLLSYSGIWPGRIFFLSWCHFLFATLVINLEHYLQCKSWFNWSCLVVVLRLCFGPVFVEKIPFFSRRVGLTTFTQKYILKWSYWPKILAPFFRTLYFLTFIILTYGCRVGDPLYNEDVVWFPNPLASGS